MPALSGRGRGPIAFEFRHASWFSPEVYACLRKSRAALCVAESDDLATPEIHPAKGLAYFRLRRNGGYTRAEIDAFAVRLMSLAKTHKVYAYFKHEAAPTGALHAVDLLAFLKAGEPA